MRNGMRRRVFGVIKKRPSPPCYDQETKAVGFRGTTPIPATHGSKRLQIRVSNKTDILPLSREAPVSAYSTVLSVSYSKVSSFVFRFWFAPTTSSLQSSHKLLFLFTVFILSYDSTRHCVTSNFLQYNTTKTKSQSLFLVDVFWIVCYTKENCGGTAAAEAV